MLTPFLAELKVFADVVFVVNNVMDGVDYANRGVLARVEEMDHSKLLKKSGVTYQLNNFMDEQNQKGYGLLLVWDRDGNRIIDEKLTWENLGYYG